MPDAGKGPDRSSRELRMCFAPIFACLFDLCFDPNKYIFPHFRGIMLHYFPPFSLSRASVFFNLDGIHFLHFLNESFCLSFEMSLEAPSSPHSINFLSENHFLSNVFPSNPFRNADFEFDNELSLEL